ncbi:hypothetical protein LTR91_023280 [Friedmanniomyces endolithicus]|uniref:Uncharacterized protein n=1 Tax=Friedmanniomyces endolithicus TaxID=329885 RepID=A0AAN6JYH7_9PEZI|nr:hypothetical protein LTS09_009372 [Friedmanniomyces endolithicus]KAK0286286.1 hypothetical protein LTR35_004721 [Friedmanniomyces endolithicus]KAK0299186.1 hypothetical protein LTS00_002297 [Friedmanniomyces endolithicus]KAK0306709.1 hypothetical protein LTR01_006004 [Friedmanniomyces endolithicus]KAK0322716.1 hypothetical protein LTR82_006172 [Friedmanniomyces endolithicus]
MAGSTKATPEVPSDTTRFPDKHTFFFDKLPPELRNKIYRLVLVTERGQIEIAGRLNIEKRNLKRQRCACWYTKNVPAYMGERSKCPRCLRLQTTETYHLEAKTLAVQGTKSRRRPLMKNAYGGSIVRITPQAHREAAAILYGENAFVFGNNAFFQRFCTQIRRKMALLRDIEVKNLRLPSECNAFSILPKDCNFQRVKIHATATDGMELEWMFRLLEPLFTKPAEQMRVFACIDVSQYDGYYLWDFEKAEKKTASALLDRRWTVCGVRERKSKRREERAKLKAEGQ